MNYIRLYLHNSILLSILRFPRSPIGNPRQHLENRHAPTRFYNVDTIICLILSSEMTGIAQREAVGLYISHGVDLSEDASFLFRIGIESNFRWPKWNAI